MWECKDKKRKSYSAFLPPKYCSVEKCPMEHWIESHINGCEWELFIREGCLDCPLKEFQQKIIDKRRIINDI